MSFYEKVTELCQKNGMTVNALIVRLGMSKSNGKSWREGAVPQMATLKKIADFFEVEVDYLITNDNADQVNVQMVNDNHGVIGKVSAPVSINNSSPDEGIDEALLSIAHQLSIIDRARLLLYANDLLNGKVQ